MTVLMVIVMVITVMIMTMSTEIQCNGMQVYLPTQMHYRLYACETCLPIKTIDHPS